MEITDPLPLEINLVKEGEFVRKLGSGTFGSVELYKYGGKEYAVKKWKINKEYDVEASPIREISCTIRLSHPNIITVESAIVTDDSIMMAMPVAASDLRKYFEKEESIVRQLRIQKYGSSLEDRKSISYSFLCAVDYCHSRNVLHRDLKPDNVLVMPNGDIKLADFGLARGLSCVEGTGKTNLVTSLWYRAPEIIFNGNYDEGGDKWSVGCILYEIMTGNPLFRSANEMVQLKNYCRRLGPYPEEIYSNFPEWESFKELNKNYPKIDKQYLFPEIVDQDMRDFISGLLEYDPQKRAKLTTIIDSLYFDSFRNFESEGYKWYGCVDNLSLRAYPIIKPNHNELNEHLIRVILSWLLDIAIYFQLDPRTYFYTNYLFHRVLNNYDILPDRSKSQEVSSCCMFIASLYGEVSPVLISDIVAIMNLRAKEAKRQTELMSTKIREIINYLRFDFLIAVSYDFFMEYSQYYPKRGREIGLTFLYVLSMTHLNYVMTPKDLALLALLCQCVYTGTPFKNVGNLDSLKSDYLKFIEILTDSTQPEDIEIYKEIFAKKRLILDTVVEKLKEGPILI